MANEKRLDLIDRGATLEELCRYCIVGIEGNCPEGGCAEFRHISQLPTVDAVEVCYCDNCVNHGNCLPEDIFRMARIEKPYCCAGKVDGDRNA